MNPRHFTISGPNGYEISCMEWMPDAAAGADTPGADSAVKAGTDSLLPHSDQSVPALPTLLCLHGFAGDKYSTVIEAVAEDRCRAGFRCVTFDWPGHGDSPADSSWLTIENCLADLEAVVKFLRPAPAPAPGISAAAAVSASSGTSAPLFCFATSFGGYLAVLCYRRHPECFDRILLRSPALRMGKVLRSFLDEDHMRRFQSGEALNFGFGRPLFLHCGFLADLETPDHNAFPPLLFSGSRPGSVLRENRPASASDPSAPAADHGSGSPKIAIIHGDADDVVPVTDSLRFAEENHLPIRIVKGADHRYKKPGELEQIIEYAAEIFPG